MSTENVEILVDSQTLRNLQAKRKKHMGVKQKLINKNERTFSGPKRWLNT